MTAPATSRLKKYLGRAVMSLALLLMQSASWAAISDENETTPRWYRVELLVFANRNPESASSEQWPLLPTLSYPDHSRTLEQDRPPMVSAEQEYTLLPLEEQLPASSAVELFQEQSIEELLKQYREKQQLRSAEFTLEPLIELEVPRSFVSLPSSDLEFTAQRRRLNRSSSTAVLAHTAWLQPMLDRESSIALRLDSAPVLGDFPELQGTILLYSARYLHIETQLWLNTDGSYLNTDWTMPAPPLPPLQQPINMSPFELTVNPWWLDPQRQWNPPPASAEIALEEQASEDPEDVSEDTEEGPLPWTEAEIQAFLDAPKYHYRHAIALQQKRRMRSGELHYIDHPMLGLLIRISRYEFEPFIEPALTGSPANNPTARR